MKKKFLNVCVMLAFFFCYPVVAFAHKIEIVPWLHGDNFNLESNFAGGKPVKGGNVRVFNSRGEKIVEGITDSNGFFSFKIKDIEGLKVVVSTSCGHKGLFKASKNRYLRGSELLDYRTESYIDKPEKVATYPTLNQIENVFRKHLSRELEEIRKTIARGQCYRIRVQDILGGIGYIIGLVGLAVYLKYTRK